MACVDTDVNNKLIAASLAYLATKIVGSSLPSEPANVCSFPMNVFRGDARSSNELTSFNSGRDAVASYVTTVAAEETRETSKTSKAV